MKNNIIEEIYENDLFLFFKQTGNNIYEVKGHGTNKYGYYIINGFLNSYSHDMVCNKMYIK